MSSQGGRECSRPTADYRAVAVIFAVVAFEFGRQGCRYVALAFVCMQVTVFAPSPQCSLLSHALRLALFSHTYARNPYLPYN